MVWISSTGFYPFPAEMTKSNPARSHLIPSCSNHSLKQSRTVFFYLVQANRDTWSRKYDHKLHWERGSCKTREHPLIHPKTMITTTNTLRPSLHKRKHKLANQPIKPKLEHSALTAQPPSIRSLITPPHIPAGQIPRIKPRFQQKPVQSPRAQRWISEVRALNSRTCAGGMAAAAAAAQGVFSRRAPCAAGKQGGGRGGGDGRPLGELPQREWCAARVGWKTAEIGGGGAKTLPTSGHFCSWLRCPFSALKPWRAERLGGCDYFGGWKYLLCSFCKSVLVDYSIGRTQRVRKATPLSANHLSIHLDK